MHNRRETQSAVVGAGAELCADAARGGGTGRLICPCCMPRSIRRQSTGTGFYEVGRTPPLLVQYSRAGPPAPAGSISKKRASNNRFWGKSDGSSSPSWYMKLISVVAHNV